MQNCMDLSFTAGDLKYSHCYTLDFFEEIPQHFHMGWAFLLVKNGELTYTVEGTTYNIKPVSLIISRPGAVHMLQVKKPITYERSSIVVSEDFLDKEILQKLPQELQVLDVSNNPMILNIYERAQFYLSNLPDKQIESMLRSLANELLMQIYIATRTSFEPPKHKREPFIAQILTYINNHIHEPLTVEQISNAMSISYGYLHQFFSKHMNMSIKKYVTLQKLLMVQKALANDVNPTEACRQYGFRSYSTFYRNYQRVFGIRPSDNPQKSITENDL